MKKKTLSTSFVHLTYDDFQIMKPHADEVCYSDEVIKLWLPPDQGRLEVVTSTVDGDSAVLFHKMNCTVNRSLVGFCREGLVTCTVHFIRR